MSFRSLEALWLLAAIPFALLFFVLRERTRTRLARRFASERLRGVTNPLRALRPWLLGAALLFAVLALAGPRAGFTLVPIVAREVNRVLVLDVSQSMAAEDVGTSRLSAAKAIAMQLADAQQGRVGLIVFEGTAEVAAPLTSDTAAVVALIDSVVPGEVGEPGSDIGTGVLAALKLLENDAAQKADIVILSDGEDQGAKSAEAIRTAKQRGIAVSAIVIGSADGATIPTSRGPLRDTTGEVVTTYARAGVLRDLAAGTGGRLLENPFAANALAPLLGRASSGTERETHARVPLERYQWPLALSIALLFLGSLAHRGAE